MASIGTRIPLPSLLKAILFVTKVTGWRENAPMYTAEEWVHRLCSRFEMGFQTENQVQKIADFATRHLFPSTEVPGNPVYVACASLTFFSHHVPNNVIVNKRSEVRATGYISKEFGNVFIDNEPVLTAANGLPVHLTNKTPAVSGSTGVLMVDGGIGVIGGVWSEGVILAQGGIDLKNSRISNVGAPITPQDAVNLSFFSANNGGVVAGTHDFAANIISVSLSQPQVTVLGCITSGIWNATPITSAYDGTGVTNFEAKQVLFGGTDPCTGQSQLTSSRTFTYSTSTQSLTLTGLNDTSGAVGTGTLIVAGRGSFGKSLYMHDVLKVDGAGLCSSLTISSSDSNVFTITGGVWFQSNTRFSGDLSCMGTTTLSTTIVQSKSDSSSPFTGSWVTAGSAGVAKLLYVGETVHVLDQASFSAHNMDGSVPRMPILTGLLLGALAVGVYVKLYQPSFLVNNTPVAGVLNTPPPPSPQPSTPPPPSPPTPTFWTIPRFD
ncbi:hypothetical protein HDU78_009523 [Chytriomyces hyalinus]|nr:hypothetical protein HDU78_009523 [Chytriomyces hyalinus]